MASSKEHVELLRVIRHDFKTPLTTLRILAELFSKMREQEQIERNCRMLVEQVDKLVVLADLYSDVALMVAGELHLAPQPGDLRDIVRAALEPLQQRVIELKLPSDPVYGQWDASHLTRAIGYLLSGANKVAVALSSVAGHATLLMSGASSAPVAPFSSSAEAFANAVVVAHGGSLSGHYRLSF